MKQITCYELYLGITIGMYQMNTAGPLLYHINMRPERDSNLGLSISHKLNHEAATLTTRPPPPDENLILNWIMNMF